MQLVPINKAKLRLELQYLILKGRSHKYIKRIPTGNQKKPYIYIYPGESKEDILKKIGEAKQERGQDSTSKALFEKVSKEIKSIFPSADIETDYKDFNSKEKISKVEYGKIALTYFQNKEKYDEVAIKMKGLRAKKKPLEKKEKQPKEKKQLTPEQEEKRIAKNEYARKRRAIIKQLREKYNKETKQETPKESKGEPKQEQPKQEIDQSKQETPKNVETKYTKELNERKNNFNDGINRAKNNLSKIEFIGSEKQISYAKYLIDNILNSNTKDFRGKANKRLLSAIVNLGLKNASSYIDMLKDSKYNPEIATNELLRKYAKLKPEKMDRFVDRKKHTLITGRDTPLWQFLGFSDQENEGYRDYWDDKQKQEIQLERDEESNNFYKALEEIFSPIK